MSPERFWIPVVLCLTFIGSIELTSSSDVTVDGSDVQASPESEKRSWNEHTKLWGKRDDTDDVIGPERGEEEAEKRKWGENKMAVWGKRTFGVDDDEVDKRKWGNDMRVWGKRQNHVTYDDDDDDIDDDNNRKRAWGQDMRVWGKRRYGGADLGDDVKRAWDNNLRVWGKRSSVWPNEQAERDDKRKWGNNMRVWGKRDAEKRKWSDNRRLWGKRAEAVPPTSRLDAKRTWGSGMRVWGKRSGAEHPQLDFEPVALPASGHVDKKSWDQNARVWGKRSKRSLTPYGAEPEEAERRLVAYYPEAKRAWNEASMRVWGKRRQPPAAGGPKRSWKTNVMRVWGKRLAEPEVDDYGAKRAWDTNSMRTWGKRSYLDSNPETAILERAYPDLADQ